MKVVNKEISPESKFTIEIDSSELEYILFSLMSIEEMKQKEIAEKGEESMHKTIENCCPQSVEKRKNLIQQLTDLWSE